MAWFRKQKQTCDWCGLAFSGPGIDEEGMVFCAQSCLLERRLPSQTRPKGVVRAAPAPTLEGVASELDVVGYDVARFKADAQQLGSLAEVPHNGQDLDALSMQAWRGLSSIANDLKALGRPSFHFEATREEAVWATRLREATLLEDAWTNLRDAYCNDQAPEYSPDFEALIPGVLAVVFLVDQPTANLPAMCLEITEQKGWVGDVESPLEPTWDLSPIDLRDSMELVTQAATQSWRFADAAAVLSSADLSRCVQLTLIAPKPQLFNFVAEFDDHVSWFSEHLDVVGLLWRRSAHITSPSWRGGDAGYPTLAGHINVRMFNVGGRSEDLMLMDTVGLDAFGLPDLQVLFPSNSMDTGATAAMLHNLALRQLESGEVMDEGDTVDGPSGPLLCQRSTSMSEPERDCTQLCIPLPPSKFSAPARGF